MKTLLLLITIFFSGTVFAQTGDWLSLFDGNTSKGWRVAGGAKQIKIEDNALVLNVGDENVYIISNTKFNENFVLEMDIKLTSVTQSAGVIFKSSFKNNIEGYKCIVDPSGNNHSGGIYDYKRNKFLFSASLSSNQSVWKLNEYQKIKIEYFEGEIKTWVNDRLISYLKDTISSKNGELAFSTHSLISDGKKAYFKNIRIRTKNIQPIVPSGGAFMVNLQDNTLSAFEYKNKWKLLFDGTSINEWVTTNNKDLASAGWKVHDGVLTFKGNNRDFADLVTKSEFKNFDLSFNFKLHGGASSGVKYFVNVEKNEGTNRYEGLEYQLTDNEKGREAFSDIIGFKRLGSLYNLISASNRYTNGAANEWNTGRIVSTAKQVTHYLNGEKVLEYNRGTKEFKRKVKASSYNAIPEYGEMEFGKILLQAEDGEVDYKNIKIKQKSGFFDIPLVRKVIGFAMGAATATLIAYYGSITL